MFCAVKKKNLTCIIYFFQFFVIFFFFPRYPQNILVSGEFKVLVQYMPVIYMQIYIYIYIYMQIYRYVYIYDNRLALTYNNGCKEEVEIFSSMVDLQCFSSEDQHLFKKCFLGSAFIFYYMCLSGCRFENVFLKFFESIMQRYLAHCVP